MFGLRRRDGEGGAADFLQVWHRPPIHEANQRKNRGRAEEMFLQQRLGKYLSVLRPMFLCVCSRFVSDDKRNEMKSKVVCLISLSNITLPVHMSMEVRAPGQKVENSLVCSSFSAKMPPSSDCYTAACATCTLTNTSDFLL